MPRSRVTRRDVARAAGALATTSAAARILPAPAIAQGRPPHTLPPLPYPDAGLDPVISARTISFHYGAHHKAYVDNLNRLAETDDFAARPLEEIIRASAAVPNRAAVFNNAAMIWNHSFYWNSLRPNGGGEPGGALKAQIEKDLGGMDRFKADYATAANGLFGSGWAWLVWHTHDRKLGLVRTANADTPIMGSDRPLLTIDVWEHAYYLDHQNRRTAYTAALIDKLLNWEWAAQQFDKAIKGG